MENSCLMSYSGLSQALGARLFTPDKPAEGKGKQTEFLPEGFSSVSIDSRTVLPGALFVALRGGSLDGHNFVDAAFKAGASGALVSLNSLEDPALGLAGLSQKWNRVLIAVEDTLKGFQDAAAAYLRQFPKLTRVGITGSSGKTTTKEIAAAIIGQEKQVVMNKGNLNSETGLPLSVYNVRSHHEVGIFEAGMSRAGEISDLAKVLNPNIAVITNIGSAHIGILGSREKIAEEKKKIFERFSGKNTALIPADDDFRDFLANGIRGRTVFYGAETLGALGATRDLGLEGTEIVWDGKAVRFGLPGRYNLQNAFAAVSLALELEINSDSIQKGLESVKPLFGRSEIFYGKVTVIRDCYNSNPESAEAALDFCDALDWPGRKIYVMGSMLELGDISEEAHAALGKRLLRSRGCRIFLYGDEMAAAVNVLKNCSPEQGIPFFHSRDMEELSRALHDFAGEGDLVLLKGSRGCCLESLTEILTGALHVS